MIKINLGFFDEESEENTAESSNNGSDSVSKNEESEINSNEQLEKLIKLRVSKETREQAEKINELQKKLEKITKQNLSNEEIKQIEIAEKEKILMDKENALLEKENRLYAIKAIKSAGLDDGTDTALLLVDFVMDKDTNKIDENVKNFNNLVTKLVASHVEKTFKANGRTPNGAANTNAGLEKQNNIAEKLGEISAERNKNSNNILNHYLGGV